MGIEVILRFGALGDMLLAIPAARARLRRQVDLHWVMARRWQEIAPFFPGRIHLLDGVADLLKLARRLRRLPIDQVHDLQGKFRSHALSWILNKPLSRYRKRNYLENLRVALGMYPIRPQNPEPVWHKYLETVGEPDAAAAAHLEWPRDYHERVTGPLLKRWNLSPQGFTIIHAGASHPGKIIPPALLNDISAELPPPLVLVGTKGGPILAGNCLDLRGLTSLHELPGLLAAARLVISTDSGPMHLARACGTPLLALFFQTDPILGFAPIPGMTQRILSRPLPCKPCSLHGQRATCPEGHWQCRDLPCADVVQSAREILGETR